MTMDPKKLKNYSGNKFYNGRALWDTGAPWLSVLSERSDGKSLWMLKECLIDYFKTGHKIAYVRRYDSEIKQKDVNGWLRDKNLTSWLNTAGYSGAVCYQGELWLTVDDDGRDKRVEHFGYAFAVNMQESYKSQHYDCYNFIFEEFITKKLYLPSEFVAFSNICSTANRSGQFRAILIGNTVARTCPYLREMGIDIFKAKPGKIYVQDLPQPNGQIVKSAFEYVNPKEKITNFIGSARKSIVAGEFEADEQPHLYMSLNDCEIVYSCVLVTELRQAFHVKRIVYDNPKNKACEKYIYVYPMDYEDVPYFKGDIFTTIPEFESGYYYYAEKRRQSHIWPLIKANRMLFSDNLAGTEFKNAIRKHNPFQPIVNSRAC